MMRLKTFIQISDIHISDHNYDAEALALYSILPKMDGFLGHSYKSLTLLAPFFRDLVQQESAELIITGDVTRLGGVREFDTARVYLERELVPPQGYYVGLNNRYSLKLAIPGNHDHYPGVPILVGGPTAGLAKMFPHMATVVNMPLGTAGHELTFLLINTDADVHPWGYKRWLARGSFVSQLKALRTQLTPQGPKEIRVLCLHHSRAHRGVTLEIDDASRDELANFIVEEGVAVLLSGHIHYPPLVKLATAVDSTGKSAEYLEARCGTTTQRNLYHVPYYWRNVLAKLRIKKRPHWSNTLLVHRISETAGEVFWESDLFLEDPRDFRPAQPVERFCMVNPRVRIWPQPVQ
jgi:hypothetical protein